MQVIDRIGRRVKLQDLHVLMTVVQAGSMAKAAARLNTGQPNISRSITELEHAVGVRLLDRHRRGVEPTSYGRALLEGGKDDKTRLIYAFRLATARKPSGKEVDVLRGLLDGRRDVFRKNRPSAVKLLGVGESQRDRRLDPAEHAAWTTVASVILNLDETITKQ